MFPISNGMDPALETKWHTLPSDEALKILGSGRQGLSAAEAADRLREHGSNDLPEEKQNSVLFIFLRQFQSPLIYILLAAAGGVYLLGEHIDAYIIMSVLVFNAIVGAIQEGRAQSALHALKKFIETSAVVVRGGSELSVQDKEVVPGDIIVLSEGEKVPADARIIESRNMKIDEAALTGESEAAHKTEEAIENPDISAPEQKNMAFKGTNIVSGHGLAVVVRSGGSTVLGQIAGTIAEIESEIPLKANIRHLSRLIVAATLVASAVIFAAGVFLGKESREMLTTVISIAVSVIPEGLPVVITLVLATGVWRMSKRNALVKRLQAVEALGQSKVIAVDKTGTLTKNEMMIQAVHVGGQTYEITGSGYDPEGGARLHGRSVSVESNTALAYAATVAGYCANARTVHAEDAGVWKVSGDPTEAAMFVLAKKLGMGKDEIERDAKQIFEIPFDYQLKYHTTVHKTTGGNFLTVVGAPEAIFALSDKVWREDGAKHMSSADRDELEDVLLELSKQGLRVLAMAVKNEGVPDTLEPGQIGKLTFVGFYGMRDALRPEVKDATRSAQEAGIKVVMITGDHKATAEAIAREVGIWRSGDLVLTGSELEELSDRHLEEMLPKIAVFARVTPEHKMRIINGYKARGEIVAMTGDGVNDAPSLVAADLGVAMGMIGTEVAKEASDIILLDDNFGSIVSAVEEGRSIYKTIKKVILYLFSTSLGEILVITGAILLGLPLPLLAAQIIWLNFITDGFLVAALAMEPKEEGLLRGDFEKPNKYLIDKLSAVRMAVMALPMMIGTLYLFGISYEADIARGWTLALTVLAVFQWFNAYNVRSERDSIFSMNPFSNLYLTAATVAVIVLQLLAVYHPFFNTILSTVPLSLSDWMLIIPIALTVVWVEETRKFFARIYGPVRSRSRSKNPSHAILRGV